MKTLEEKIKVMQALEDGKHIEFRTKDSYGWWPTKDPEFNWGLNDYRIKEELKKKVKLYQILLQFNKSKYYTIAPQMYETIEQAQDIYKYSSYKPIKLLPHTEFEVEID